MKTYYIITCLLILILSQQMAPAQQPLAQQVLTIFQEHCLDCHGEFGSYTDALLIKHANLIVDRAVIPKQPDASELYLRLLGDTDTGSQMPLRQEPLDPEAIATIRQWIAAGAPDWEAIPQPERRFITTDAMLQTIYTHVTSLTTFDRSFARYFTVTHLYNAGATDDNLRAYRNVLSKLVNSLSWDAEIIKPTSIDPEQTIFYIDLRHYAWDSKGDKWYKIEQAYPYGVQLNSSTYTTLCKETDCDLPFVRADWFIATASLPPLYHEILGLPETDKELETQLEEAGGVFGGSEPMQKLVKQFEEPLDATHAAAEVGLETEDFLKEIRENRTLRKAGLLVLMVKPVINPDTLEPQYGTVKRDAWESQFAEIVAALQGQVISEALGITKPTYKFKVKPKYPDAAKKAEREGTVILQLTINENGFPKDIVPLTSLGFGLEAAVIEALKKTTFHPATKGGTPISLNNVQISYEFKL
ncbi:TonB family protein [Candidatus Poribacteria bacterium]|nr:TonB family protein [Candidatus Poribacteria bacterium]